jgi:serine protease
LCRFYTDAFAGKPSHFYTASAAECEYVEQQLSAWTFEGVVFHVQVPDATCACASGSAPVYRLYNDGRGGAPNHAYTPDAARRDRLMAAGWLAEGAAWCARLAL